jgi:transketolase
MRHGDRYIKLPYKGAEVAAFKKLQEIKKRCLKTMLGMYKKANAGHIGASLSCMDILVYLFFSKMKKEDQFILSKGHAAAALYTVLAESGRMPAAQLESFYSDGTYLAAHPPCGGKIQGIPFGTGSLGHGLSLAAGIALSTRFIKQKYGVFCVLSDGDCNEGSTWEAALFAAHHRLDNLTVIIDRNGLQGFGASDEVLNLNPLKKKWESFNFNVACARNGNDFRDIDAAFKRLKSARSKKPGCIIAGTTKGSGVSYMENRMEWHYLPMDDGLYEKALADLGLKDA